jgi:hypothetical protein
MFGTFLQMMLPVNDSGFAWKKGGLVVYRHVSMDCKNAFFVFFDASHREERFGLSRHLRYARSLVVETVAEVNALYMDCFLSD